MSLLKLRESKATVVVGLDFGTTFSGFAYALTSSKQGKCQLFYEWPGLQAAGAKNYCKTQTSLLYSKGSRQSNSSESYVLQTWGHEALVQHALSKQPRQQTVSERSHGDWKSIFGRRIAEMPESEEKTDHFVTRFKLHLAGSEKTSAAELPPGLTPRRTISDYLRKLSELIIDVLHKTLGDHINKEDIQWCITVPAVWDEQAKQEMKTCAEIAGLVQGPLCNDRDASPHPAIIVLEPEAASFYCQQTSDFPLDDGDKFLVVDAGGGTVDLAIHQKAGPPWSKKVREVALSSGGLCGGTYVDEEFFKILRRKIGCFRTFAEEHPQTVLKLIEEARVPDLKTMMIVGGFSASPYLQRRIKVAFSQKLAAGTIFFPKEPGSAICCGAVAFGVSKADLIMSRISKRTYGIRLARSFRPGDPELFRIPGGNSRCTWLCSNSFSIYTKRGQTVPVDACVSKTKTPVDPNQTDCEISMFSTSAIDPAYVTDPDVVKEGTFTIKFPSTNELGKCPKIKVSMYFGRTMIEVKAVGEKILKCHQWLSKDLLNAPWNAYPCSRVVDEKVSS